MKRFLAIVLMLSLLCALTCVSAAAAVPEEIKYDFDSAEEMNDWQTLGGSWKIQDGCLKQTSGTPGAWNIHCCLKDVQVKDFTAHFRIKVAKENLGMGWAGFYFRKVNLTDHQEQSGYGLTIEGKSSKGKTVVVDWAHSCKTFEGQCRANANDWNEVVLSVSGNVIKVYLNDDIAKKTPTLEVVDKDNGWMDAGYLSFASGNAKIDVDFFYLYTGASQDKAFGSSAQPTEPPTEPTVPPTEPTVPPTEPTVPPTEPTVPPTEPTVPPTEPTVPPTEPTVPPTEPTVPPTEPTVPPTEPTVPPTEPTIPPTEPTVPPTEPTVPPTEPTVPPTEPTEPKPTEPAEPVPPLPSGGNNTLSIILGVVGIAGIAIVVAIYFISNKRKKA